MLRDDIPLLEKSGLVAAIIDQSTDERGAAILTRIRVKLRNGWLMDCRERIERRGRRYSFHIFADGILITRWDNSPYHPRDCNTFPFHRHLSDGSVVDSEDMDTAKVLAYLETRIQSP